MVDHKAWFGHVPAFLDTRIAMHGKASTLRRHRRAGQDYARLDGRQVGFGPSRQGQVDRAFGEPFLGRWYLGADLMALLTALVR